MGQLTAVDPQNSCRFYRVNLFTNAISRFTTISMIFDLKLTTSLQVCPLLPL